MVKEGRLTQQHLTRLSCDIAAIKGKIDAVTRRRHLIPEALASSARLNLLTGSPRSPCVGLVLRARCDEEDGREQARVTAGGKGVERQMHGHDDEEGRAEEHAVVAKGARHGERREEHRDQRNEQ